ncbi:MAG: IPT/TIG domain-containing protein, partial [Candidatus Poribacteria bacterium]|nr:IPT/TIG domain-containing protein [Candidatus Poribacteria bacterium]
MDGVGEKTWANNGYQVKAMRIQNSQILDNKGHGIEAQSFYNNYQNNHSMLEVISTDIERNIYQSSGWEQRPYGNGIYFRSYDGSLVVKDCQIKSNGGIGVGTSTGGGWQGDPIANLIMIDNQIEGNMTGGIAISSQQFLVLAGNQVLDNIVGDSLDTIEMGTGPGMGSYANSGRWSPEGSAGVNISIRQQAIVSNNLVSGNKAYLSSSQQSQVTAGLKLSINSPYLSNSNSWAEYGQQFVSYPEVDKGVLIKENIVRGNQIISRGSLTNNENFLSWGSLVGGVRIEAYSEPPVTVSQQEINRRSIVFEDNVIELNQSPHYAAGYVNLQVNYNYDNYMNMNYGDSSKPAELTREQLAATNAFTHNTVINNQSSESGSAALHLKGEGLFAYNDVYDNAADYAVYLGNDNSDATFQAGYNWWGTIDAPTISSQIYDMEEDFNRGRLNFSPLLPDSQQNMLAGPAQPEIKIISQGGTTLFPIFRARLSVANTAHRVRVGEANTLSSAVWKNLSALTTGQSGVVELVDDGQYISLVQDLRVAGSEFIYVNFEDASGYPSAIAFARPPQIMHPQKTETIAGQPVVVNVRLSSVLQTYDAFLYWRPLVEGIDFTPILMQSSISGLTSARIDGRSTVQGVEYYIQIEDESGNVLVSMPEVSPTDNPIRLTAKEILAASLDPEADQAIEFAVGLTVELPQGFIDTSSEQATELKVANIPPAVISQTAVNLPTGISTDLSEAPAQRLTVVQGDSEIKTFDKPVTLTFNYDEATVVNSEADLRVYVLDENNRPQLAGGEVNTVDNYVRVAIDHFSDFLVLEGKSLAPTPSAAIVPGQNLQIAAAMVDYLPLDSSWSTEAVYQFRLGDNESFQASQTQDMNWDENLGYFITDIEVPADASLMKYYVQAIDIGGRQATSEWVNLTAGGSQLQLWLEAPSSILVDQATTIKIQLRDAFDELVMSETDLLLDLATASETGLFSATVDGAGNQSLMSIILAGQSEVVFYYQDSQAGVTNLTITPQSDQFDAITQSLQVTAGTPLTLTKVAPTQGGLMGGITVTLTGTGFLAGATVTFGDKTVDVVVDDAGTTITAVVPASSAGAVDVTVTNSDGQAGTLPQAFSYNSAPTLTNLTPTQGGLMGGITVTLTGTGFLAGATVTFGDKTVDVVVD